MRGVQAWFLGAVFRVKGSFKQKPGCPDYAHGAMSKERLEKLCRGECYNPTDERHQITRIEVVRIKPQARPDEPVGPLIEDPWKRFDCAPSPDGCVVEFTTMSKVSSETWCVPTANPRASQGSRCTGDQRIRRPFT